MNPAQTRHRGRISLNGFHGCWIGEEYVYMAPLLAAAAVGWLDCIDYLLHSGADLNIRQRLHLTNSDILSSHLSHPWLAGHRPDYGCRPHVECDGTELIHRQCVNALDVAIIYGQEEAAFKLIDLGIVSVRSIGSRTSSLEYAFSHGRTSIIRAILARPEGSITTSELLSVSRTIMRNPELEGELELLDTLLDIEAYDPQFSSRPLSVYLVNTALTDSHAVDSRDVPCAENALHLFQRLAQQGRADRPACLSILDESLNTVRGYALAQAVLAHVSQLRPVEGASLLHRLIGHTTRDNTSAFAPMMTSLVDAGASIDETHLQRARERKLWNIVELLETVLEAAKGAPKLTIAA
ncbi:hypothetical protein F4810DRAFT_665763 [Camillea tinctor]|nr:hypothetical protein F4810DRAFT_665763 [Camillea tinctor]